MDKIRFKTRLLRPTTPKVATFAEILTRSGDSAKTICLSVVAGLVACFLTTSLETVAETTQEEVHRMSHQVMPFEMSKTVHVFRMTEYGGVEQVLVRDPEMADQVALIRKHLNHEAMKFGRGDYSDPAELHGTDMPGLAELRANPEAVEVTYAELPAGAQITFRTDDLKMLTAIHRWFGAQLSEHGADARAE